MERRGFLRWCAGSAVLTLVGGCVDDSLSANARRPRDVSVVGGRDGGSIALSPGRDGSVGGGGGGRPDASVNGGNPDGSSSGTPPECTEFVDMHDTYAQALYFDGGLGPTTGTITVAAVMAGGALDLEFWHGHGGENHRFTVTPQHFASLKRGERVMIETTTVEGHTHNLFIDPVDESYRVPGSPNVRVPNC